ncbi:MAG: glycosyltransferase family 2 protein [Candidatus Andersenbacteria bacterium]
MSTVLPLVLQIVAWTSFGLAAAAFVGYPIAMVVAAAVRAPRRSQALASAPPPQPPKVAIVIAAYNEEAGIAHTLESMFAQDYPSDRRKIIVFSDGSTDTTDEVVRGFASRGVQLVRYPRLGKTECQNRTVESLPADIDVVAFADGNVRWERGALTALVAPFAQQNVAATTGKLMYQRATVAGAAVEEREHEGLFRRVDESIKAGESALVATVGVNGPIYAVRRSEYVRLRADYVSDLVLPVLLVARGRRVVYVPAAIAREPASPDVVAELARKRRLVTQGLVALPLLVRAGWRSRTPGLLSMLLFHKVLRWFGLELLALSFVLMVALLPRPVYVVTVSLGLLAIAGALVAIARALSHRSAGPLMPLGYFLLTTWGGVLGKVDLLRGERAATWRTAQRQGAAAARAEAAPALLPSSLALSIVIVTYQSRADIGACLRSLKEHAPKAPHEIFVVDNASTDGTADYVASSFRDVTLIRSTTNQGFGRANNRAIERARGRYIVALNPDARVTAGALDTLVTLADQQPKLGTLAPKLVFPDGSRQPNSYWFPALGPGVAQLLFLEKLLERQAARATLTSTEWSTGAALLFPRVIDKTLTRFDPEIFLYSEDVDLCWTLHQKGRLNYATARATVTHALNRSGEQFFAAGSSDRADEARFAEWKKTLRYVAFKHWRGIFKGARFRLYCQLRALIALERAWVLPLRKLPADKRTQLSHEHHAAARAFARA